MTGEVDPRRLTYRMVAPVYLENGWSPIPLPARRKKTPPKEFTGADGFYVTKKHLEEWGQPGQTVCIKYRDQETGLQKEFWFNPANLALRLPKNVIGIDVDMYEGKDGESTLAKAVAAWGKLPKTWMTTSKEDGSGIRLFQVPEGLAWPGDLSGHFGHGIELIRWDHRYAIAFPSIHPSGSQYRWINPEGEVDSDVFTPHELPFLPKKWVDGLTSGKQWEHRPAAELEEGGAQAWLDARNGPESCHMMETTLNKWLVRIRDASDEGGLHEAFLYGVKAVVGDAASGHSGVARAVKKLNKAFKTHAVNRESAHGKRSEGGAKYEAKRIIDGAVAKVMAEGEPDDEDMCALLRDDTMVPKKNKRGSGPNGRSSSSYDFTRDDIGNAQRLVGYCGDDIRYVEALGGWHTWNGTVWEPDRTGQLKRWASVVVRDMAQEAEFIEDVKEKAAFFAFIRASSNLGKIKAMIEMAASLNGITVPGEVFNGDPKKFLCTNGVAELLPTGVKFRPASREDYITVQAGGAYEPGSWKGTAWEDFLKRFVPDKAVRSWLQRAAGYSLYGRNPKRLLFLVKGKTSSGKTTLAESLRSALGGYAAPFDLSLFREQKEQGSNVQLVKLLDRRFIVASETSTERYLHADQVKRVTGSDAVSARLNHANEMVEKVPAFTPWIVSNNPPTIQGADQALWRRLYTIPFDQTIAKEDEDSSVGEWLLEEAGRTAVLSWAIEGWDAYVKEGLDDIPAAMVEATMRTREELSDLDVFLTDCCERGAGLVEMATDLYQAYKDWCEDTGVDADSLHKFGRLLSGRGHDKERKRKAGGGDSKYWYRTGIRLNDEWARRLGVSR